MLKEGIKVELIDLQTVRPLDNDTIIKSVKKTNRLVIPEEAWPLASISPEITYQVQKYAFEYLDAPIHKLNNLDVPLAYAPTLIEASIPGEKNTVDTIKNVIYSKQ